MKELKKCINCGKKKVNEGDCWCTIDCKEKFFVKYYKDSFIRIKHDLLESKNPEHQKFLNRAKDVGFVEAVIELGEEQWPSQKKV